MNQIVYVLLALLLAGCAELSSLAPLTVNFQVKADAEKREVCQQVARDSGVNLADGAPLTVAMDASDDHRVTITRTGVPKPIVDEPRPWAGWRDLCRDALQRAKAIPTPTLRLADFVNDRLMGDPAFKALATSADFAQQAMDAQGDTPIDELDEGTPAYEEVVKLVNSAQDAHRSYQTFQWKVGVLDTKGAVFADDMTAPDANKVQLPGTTAFLRVSVSGDRVQLSAIESSKGRQIVTFSGGLPSITQLFHTYMVGDRVDLRGAINRRIRRGKASDAPVASPGVGCVKDTDCKADRVCETGKCVSPPSRY